MLRQPLEARSSTTALAEALHSQTRDFISSQAVFTTYQVKSSQVSRSNQTVSYSLKTVEIQKRFLNDTNAIKQKFTFKHANKHVQPERIYNCACDSNYYVSVN